MVTTVGRRGPRARPLTSSGPRPLRGNDIAGHRRAPTNSHSATGSRSWSCACASSGDTPSGLGRRGFGIQSAAASRDLALYKDWPRQHRLRLQGQVLRPGAGLPACLRLSPERVLSWLTQGFGDGEPMRLKAWVASESPSRLTHPDLDVLAGVTRRSTRAVRSASSTTPSPVAAPSGRSSPFALIDNGLAGTSAPSTGSPRSSGISSSPGSDAPSCSKGQPVAPHEMSDQDIQWTRIVELELVPHPDQPGRRSPRWTTACRAACCG